MNTTQFYKWICRSALVLALVATAFAQTDRGTITGTVLDPSHSVVAGASIIVKNAATGVVYLSLIHI